MFWMTWLHPLVWMYRVGGHAEAQRPGWSSARLVKRKGGWAGCCGRSCWPGDELHAGLAGEGAPVVERATARTNHLQTTTMHVAVIACNHVGERPRFDA